MMNHTTVRAFPKSYDSDSFEPQMLDLDAFDNLLVVECGESYTIIDEAEHMAKCTSTSGTVSKAAGTARTKKTGQARDMILKLTGWIGSWWRSIKTPPPPF